MGGTLAPRKRGHTQARKDATKNIWKRLKDPGNEKEMTTFAELEVGIRFTSENRGVMRRRMHAFSGVVSKKGRERSRARVRENSTHGLRL